MKCLRNCICCCCEFSSDEDEEEYEVDRKSAGKKTNKVPKSEAKPEFNTVDNRQDVNTYTT